MWRGLIEKTVREVRVATLIFAATLMLFEVLVAYIFPTFREEFGTWLKIEFIQALLSALLGSELGDSVGPHTLTALPWVHPIVLAIVWAHEITLCTRLPAGEIDRGTIDVLLGLPVSRWTLYLCESAVWLVSGVFLLTAAATGNTLGSYLAEDATPTSFGVLCCVLLNFYCLYVAVGGIAYLVSALSSKKGTAVGWIFAIIIGSFLLNFLEPFWKPAEAISFLSLLSYYRPIAIFQDVGWPLADMAILLLVGGGAWFTGGVVFRRRNICTV